MLVLTRGEDEIIRIGDDISIMVVEVGWGQVRLGINAPKEIPIHREEVYQKIQEEKT